MRNWKQEHLQMCMYAHLNKIEKKATKVENCQQPLKDS